MGYWRVWVIQGMGYERVNCNYCCNLIDHMHDQIYTSTWLQESNFHPLATSKGGISMIQSNQDAVADKFSRALGGNVGHDNCQHTPSRVKSPLCPADHAMFSI